MKGGFRMTKLRELWKKYREQLTYLIFGGLTTLVNLVVYRLLTLQGLTTDPATITATLVSILFAYATNRRWVFESRARGAAAWREFGSFFICRLVTLVLDWAFMKLTVDLLGPRIVAPAQLDMWGLAMKLASNIVVVVVNYIFSKLLIFRKK